MTSVQNDQKLSKYIDSYIDELKRCADLLKKDHVEVMVEMIMDAYKKGKKVFIIGNGGSASNASHMACDFGKGTLARVYDDRKKRFKVYSLTDNVAMMTAIANDICYEDIFVQQLENLIEAGDVVIALSGSGNSENVVRAVKYANKRRAKTIGILGFKTGGKLAGLVQCPIVVDSNHYGICEDIQLVLDHIITDWLAKLRVKNTA